MTDLGEHSSGSPTSTVWGLHSLTSGSSVAAGGAGFAGSDAKLCKKLTSHCCSCHVLVKLQHAFRCHETKKQVAGKG